MKKIFFLLTTAIAVTASANAQVIMAAIEDINNQSNNLESTINKDKKEEKKELRKQRNKEVSYLSLQSFPVDFPGATSTEWKSIENYDEATFMKDGQSMSAFYDWDGKLVGTTEDKTFNDLPPIAQKYINDKYRGYTPEAVVFYDDNEFNETNMVMYDNEFSDEDSYFVELQKGSERIVLHVKMNGDVLYYTSLK